MKTKSRWTALAAAFVLLALTARTDVAYGAVGIETEKKCSITFDLSVTYEKKPDTDLPADSTFPEDPGLTETVSADRYEELKNASIEVTWNGKRQRLQPGRLLCRQKGRL